MSKLTAYESDIKEVNAPVAAIYNTLSDLNNISKIEDRIPKEKVKGLKFDSDSCTVTVDPIGEIKFHICDREPNKCIKFTAEKSPVPIFFWIQMLPLTETTSKIKVTCKVELNMILRNMVSKKLTEGVNRVAEVLSQIPYQQ